MKAGFIFHIIDMIDGFIIIILVYIYIEYVQKHMIITSMIIFIVKDVIAFIMVFVSYACAF